MIKVSCFISILLSVGLVTCSKAAVHEMCAECPVSTLDAAISASTPGDSINIWPGTYYEANVSISKPLTIVGNGDVLFDGGGRGYILKITADQVAVSGITFINSGKSYTHDYAAIYISKSKNFSIVRNKIINPYFGILVEKSHEGTIAGNIISGNSKREDDSGNGIHLWHCSKIKIIKNEVTQLRDGIYFEFVSESTVSENDSHGNIRYGLHFMFSNNDEYSYNRFYNNGAGVAVMFSKFILMHHNKFVKNWGTASYGLLLKEIYDAEIKDNSFEENTIAIFIEGSTRINYIHNDFARNGWAIKIAGAAYKNYFTLNNFVHNAFDLSYSGKINDNVFDGNYWSSYRGYDLDRNKVGDIPYRPVKLFSYIVNNTPETIVLLRSLFIDIINFSESVSPVFTPDNLADPRPMMYQL